MSRRIFVLTVALLSTALLVTGYGQAIGYAAPEPAVVPLAETRASDTLTIAPTPTTPTPPVLSPEPVLSEVEGQSRRVEGKVTAYGLNVRTGPGTAYSIIGGLSQGDVVEVVGKNATSDWLQIVYPADSDGRVWVAAAYVDLTGSLTEVPEVSAPPPPTPGLGQRSSPNGRPELTGKLVFQVCNGCDIYIINADGSGLRRLTDGLDPAWSPDGKKVAFARWRDPRGIYVIDEDGSNETLLLGWSQAKAPAWSPDGSRIIFTRQHGGQEEDIEVSSWLGFPLDSAGAPLVEAGVGAA